MRYACIFIINISFTIKDFVHWNIFFFSMKLLFQNETSFFQSGISSPGRYFFFFRMKYLIFNGISYYSMKHFLLQNETSHIQWNIFFLFRTKYPIETSPSLDQKSSYPVKYLLLHPEISHRNIFFFRPKIILSNGISSISFWNILFRMKHLLFNEISI